MQEFVHRALLSYARYFPVRRGKDRVLALLWKPLSFGTYRRQTTLRFSKARMMCDVTQYLQRHLYFYGGYEDGVCRLWMKSAANAQTIFDIGANVGLYSLLAATGNPAARVHAFEPTPDMVHVLKENIQLNGLQNVSVNAVAVGIADGRGFLHSCMGKDGDNEGMNFVTDHVSHKTDLAVDQVSIGEYCRRRQIERIDLMKMDIEGGEYNALLGARNMLRAHAIGLIFIELTEWAANRSGYSTVDVKRILFDAGYHVYRFCAGKLTRVRMEGIHNGDNVVAFAREPSMMDAVKDGPS